jgi:hypothetical protein
LLFAQNFVWVWRHTTCVSGNNVKKCMPLSANDSLSFVCIVYAEFFEPFLWCIAADTFFLRTHKSTLFQLHKIFGWEIIFHPSEREDSFAWWKERCLHMECKTHCLCCHEDLCYWFFESCMLLAPFHIIPHCPYAVQVCNNNNVISCKMWRNELFQFPYLDLRHIHRTFHVCKNNPR